MNEPLAARPLGTVGSTAIRLHVSKDTVRRLIARGDIPALKVGRVLRIDPDEVDAYLTRQAQP